MKRDQLWLDEEQTPDLRLGLRVRSVLRRERTAYQDLLVVDTEAFGHVMFLDGCFMVTEKDEFFYHEMLAHVPLMAHPGPKQVLIVGGGDGGTLREVLKHPEVEEAWLCDIDQRVTDAARDFFPTLAVSLDDPRAKILHQDAVELVAGASGKWDVILVDSTDPVGPAEGLFAKPFFSDLRRALTPGGIAVCQAESPLVNADVLRRTYLGLKECFPEVALYTGPAPTYPSGYWSYAVGYSGGDLTPHSRQEPLGRYYTKAVHQAAFALPPFVQELLR
jgi:spermidine synthase